MCMKEILEKLETLPPTRIEEIIKQSVMQLIDDYEDYIEEVDDKKDREYHEKLVNKWEDILERIKSKDISNF